MGGYVFAGVGRYIIISVSNFLAPNHVRLSPNLVSHRGREVIKFLKVKVKGQGRWGRYAVHVPCWVFASRLPCPSHL